MTKKVFKTILFWLAACTWGIIMTLPGAIVALVLIITGHKPKTYGPAVYFVVGNGWGGISLGGFFFVSNGSNTLNSKTHELGHSTVQQWIFGPLFLFIIGIPSFIRCQYFNYLATKGRYPNYYKIWFERTASEWGMKFYEKTKDEFKYE